MYTFNAAKKKDENNPLSESLPAGMSYRQNGRFKIERFQRVDKIPGFDIPEHEAIAFINHVVQPHRDAAISTAKDPDWERHFNQRTYDDVREYLDTPDPFYLNGRTPRYNPIRKVDIDKGLRQGTDHWFVGEDGKPQSLKIWAQKWRHYQITGKVWDPEVDRTEIKDPESISAGNSPLGNTITEYRPKKHCTTCAGSGTVPFDSSRCPSCHGDGTDIANSNLPCHICKQPNGEPARWRCNRCDGKGFIEDRSQELPAEPTINAFSPIRNLPILLPTDIVGIAPHDKTGDPITFVTDDITHECDKCLPVCLSCGGRDSKSSLDKEGFHKDPRRCSYMGSQTGITADPRATSTFNSGGPR